MMAALLAALVLVSAPVQAAIATALVRDPVAAPVLPVALVVGWAVMRRAEETWPAILAPALVLGVASEERIGWFLLALLPAPALIAAGVRRFRPGVTGVTRRLLVAWSTATLGGAAYGAVLLVAAGLGAELPAHAGALLAAGVLSGLLAVVAALCFWPLRPRERSLFA